MTRALLALLGALAAAAALAPAASAGPIVDRAAEALADDPIYVDADAERPISSSEADELRDRIARADAGPIYVAILPEAARDEAGGDPAEVARSLARALGRGGTYAVVVGDQFRAGSTTREGVARLADEAYAEHRDEGVGPTLLAFVDSLGQGGAEGGDDGGRGAGALVLPLLAVGGIGFFLYRRKKRRQEEADDFGDVRRAAQDDLLALADDIRALDLDVKMPGVPEEAARDYEQALNAYERADAALDHARRPEDLEAVSAAVEEGRYAIAAAKARLEGRPLPERRAPCFFDPRHGPSSRDVEWAPPYGEPRLVPACEADAQMVERGLEPAPREVTVGGRTRPYWDAPPQYGPWAGGYFGGFGGLFPGILLGSMLGGAFAPPVYVDQGGDVGGGGDWGGGDFGDGDFGGGGGDFGGGDFGGGDFGGG